MTRRIKIILGVLVFIILISISIKLILLRGSFKLPFKFYILFAILFIATYGFYKKIYWLRYVTLISSLAYLGFYQGSCLCSTGSLESIFMYIGMGRYSNLGVSLFRLGILFAVVYFFGNIFCGWVCHKGAVQEFLYRESFAIRLPKALDNILKKARYFFLFLIIFYPIIKGHRIFNKMDPFKVLFNLEGTTVLVIFLGILLFSSIFIYRPFCRYVCPLGALLGIINKIGLFDIKLKKPEKCIHKNICERKCPAQTLTMKEAPVINKEYCFSCLECERRCPMHCLDCDKLF